MYRASWPIWPLLPCYSWSIRNTVGNFYRSTITTKRSNKTVHASSISFFDSFKQVRVKRLKLQRLYQLNKKAPLLQEDEQLPHGPHISNRAHAISLHACVSSTTPLHECVRVRSWSPPPHCDVHSLHLDHWSTKYPSKKSNVSYSFSS